MKKICGICYKSSGKKVQCKTCPELVHKGCLPYKVSGKFICDACTAGLGRRSRKCQLCLRSLKGFFIRSEGLQNAQNGWVHLPCVMYLNGCRCEVDESGRLKADLSNISLKKNSRCCYCKKKGGNQISCLTCGTSCHVPCGAVKGFVCHYLPIQEYLLWTVDEVANWLRLNEMDQWISKIREKNINGEALSQLSWKKVQTSMEIKRYEAEKLITARRRLERNGFMNKLKSGHHNIWIACPKHKDLSPDPQLITKRKVQLKIEPGKKEVSSSSEDILQVPCLRCGTTGDEAHFLLCESPFTTCNNGAHTYCLNPPLTKVPDGMWYCPPCTDRYYVGVPCSICEHHVYEKEKIVNCNGYACSEMMHTNCFEKGDVKQDWLCKGCEMTKLLYPSATKLQREVSGTALSCDSSSSSSPVPSQPVSPITMNQKLYPFFLTPPTPIDRTLVKKEPCRANKAKEKPKKLNVPDGSLTKLDQKQKRNLTIPSPQSNVIESSTIQCKNQHPANLPIQPPHRVRISKILQKDAMDFSPIKRENNQPASIPVKLPQRVRISKILHKNVQDSPASIKIEEEKASDKISKIPKRVRMSKINKNHKSKQPTLRLSPPNQQKLSDGQPKSYGKQSFEISRPGSKHSTPLSTPKLKGTAMVATVEVKKKLPISDKVLGLGKKLLFDTSGPRDFRLRIDLLRKCLIKRSDELFKDVVSYFIQQNGDNLLQKWLGQSQAYITFGNVPEKKPSLKSKQAEKLLISIVEILDRMRRLDIHFVPKPKLTEGVTLMSRNVRLSSKIKCWALEFLKTWQDKQFGTKRKNRIPEVGQKIKRKRTKIMTKTEERPKMSVHSIPTKKRRLNLQRFKTTQRSCEVVVPTSKFPDVDWKMVILGKYGTRKSKFEDEFDVRISLEGCGGVSNSDSVKPLYILLKAREQKSLEKAKETLSKLIWDQKNHVKLQTSTKEEKKDPSMAQFPAQSIINCKSKSPAPPKDPRLSGKAEPRRISYRTPPKVRSGQSLPSSAQSLESTPLKMLSPPTGITNREPYRRRIPLQPNVLCKSQAAPFPPPHGDAPCFWRRVPWKDDFGSLAFYFWNKKTNEVTWDAPKIWLIYDPLSEDTQDSDCSFETNTEGVWGTGRSTSRESKSNAGETAHDLETSTQRESGVPDLKGSTNVSSTARTLTKKSTSRAKLSISPAQQQSLARSLTVNTPKKEDLQSSTSLWAIVPTPPVQKELTIEAQDQDKKGVVKKAKGNEIIDEPQNKDEAKKLKKQGETRRYKRWDSSSRRPQSRYYRSYSSSKQSNLRCRKSDSRPKRSRSWEKHYTRSRRPRSRERRANNRSYNERHHRERRLDRRSWVRNRRADCQARSKNHRGGGARHNRKRELTKISRTRDFSSSSCSDMTKESRRKYKSRRGLYGDVKNNKREKNSLIPSKQSSTSQNQSSLIPAMLPRDKKRI